jgi:hypothetical protein
MAFRLHNEAAIAAEARGLAALATHREETRRNEH